MNQAGNHFIYRHTFKPPEVNEAMHSAGRGSFAMWTWLNSAIFRVECKEAALACRTECAVRSSAKESSKPAGCIS